MVEQASTKLLLCIMRDLPNTAFSNLATTSVHPDWAVSSVVEHCLHTRSFQVARLFPHHIFALTFSRRNFRRPALVCTQ